MSAGERQDAVADYVLGLMDEDAAARFEAAMRTDATLGREVEEGRRRFLPLDETAAPVLPAETLWTGITRRLAADRAVLQREPHRFGLFQAALWNDLSLWRGLAGGAAAVAATLAAFMAWDALRPPAADAPRFVAVLTAEGNPLPGAIVEVGDGGAALLVPLRDIPVPAGRALQVWTLQDRAQGPISIGLAPSARSLPLRLDRLAPTRSDQLFEITLEPANGSPTGRPTGPILYKGVAVPAL